MPNYFALFQLPERFSIDLPKLDETYRIIQKQVHPDRFVTATEMEKRTAMQWATMINDAYHVLRHPLRRGIYLCALHGHDVQKDTSILDSEFLTLQLEWRETLQKIKQTGNQQELDTLTKQHANLSQQQMQKIERLLDQHQFETAVQEVKKMMFFDKLGEEISQTINELDAKN